MFDEDFDPRGCQVVLALVVCFWIALAALVWDWLT
jgi:hypothetical protein